MNEAPSGRRPWIDLDPQADAVSTICDVPFVAGHVSPGWEGVARVFADNFARGELGASCSVVSDGKRVVDLWGGQTQTEGSAWEADTLAVFFSCTKIITALVIHHLIAEGRLSLDTPLTDVWPELTAGQQGGTLRMALAHTLGLPALSRKLKAGAYNDHEYMAEQLACQEPLWPPGTRVGYHAITYGFVLGEVVRRVAGTTVGRYFTQHFAEPLGLDLHLGLSPSVFSRLAPIQTYRPTREDPVKHVALTSQDIGSVQNLWFFNAGGWRTEDMNSQEGLKPELPAVNGAGNGRSLACLMALFNDGQALGQLGLNDDTVAGLEAVTAASHRDATLLCRSRFSLGMMKSMDNRDDPGADNFIIGRSAFGHVGMGGSFGFCDREARLSAGYVMNQQGHGILLNERGQRLVDAIYQCAGFDRIAAGAWVP